MESRKEKGPGNRVSLSGRLQMLADMVTPGNRLVDVGCDHAFLSIWLVSAGICPKALAMDVRRGPLASAGANIEAFGMGDYIETRLSDGLREYSAGEADTLVCAGMGGRLMERILRADMDKAGKLLELILQPQSELPEFRRFLRENGFAVIQENAVWDEGKYYFAMKAVPAREKAASETEVTGRQQLYDLYGEQLLVKRHPVLEQYLRQRQGCVRQLEASLAAADSGKARARLREVQSELSQIAEALDFFMELES
ncbi:MAG: SAM-dependent methyltransferase [Lachnospiraceae bacterium]|nr:SAM-dependent methyltransferase [Lachnospiraceae bacterium]